MIETFESIVPIVFKAIQFDTKNIKEIEKFTNGKIKSENLVFNNKFTITKYTLVLKNSIELSLCPYDYIVKEPTIIPCFTIYSSYIMNKLFINTSLNYDNNRNKKKP